jgi:CheY-like chemotaxis protein/DNA-directed RNA polymerase specialized sigma24 family protein
MSISGEIGPHLPMLRRFARALAGSQALGDSNVAATLEAMLEDRTLFDRALDPRVGLYRAFLQVWRASPGNGDASGDLRPEEAAASRNLAALPLAPRVAFLLSALESFEIGDIGKILDCGEADARRLLDHAAREVAQQMRTNVLIIEDEPLIALDLQYIVEQLGHKVENVARTQVQAVRGAMKNRPGLILADIQLADGSSGLAAVNEILERQQAPVIFITAFPERLLTGHAPEPTFLITKPFSADAVKAAISQALFFDRKSRRPSEGVDPPTTLQSSPQQRDQNRAQSA